MHKNRARFIFIVGVTIIFGFLAVFTGGCTHKQSPVKTPEATEQPEEPDEAPRLELPDVTETDAEPELDLEKIKPNEMGKVMIVMYHDISEKEATWSRTYENFRKDLELFYNEGYRLISLTDFIHNEINVPAGYTPLIITFDDGHRGQFNAIEKDGELEVDPNSAVGIMENFVKLHPDFGKSATFYIYYPVPFRQKKLIGWKLKHLVENGMEVGNHTYTHPNLAGLARDEIIKQLALNVKKTREYLPDYTVNSLALPNGGIPAKNFDAAVNGTYEGVSYTNKAILLVGANPAFSPVDKKFNPLKLPRVRGSSEYIDKWVEYFRRNPGERFISDGDPDVVTVPEKYKDRLNPEALKGKTLRVY